VINHQKYKTFSKTKYYRLENNTMEASLNLFTAKTKVTSLGDSPKVVLANSKDSKHVGMKRCLVNKSKDSVVRVATNNKTWKLQPQAKLVVTYDGVNWTRNVNAKCSFSSSSSSSTDECPSDDKPDCPKDDDSWSKSFSCSSSDDDDKPIPPCPPPELKPLVLSFTNASSAPEQVKVPAGYNWVSYVLVGGGGGGADGSLAGLESTTGGGGGGGGSGEYKTGIIAAPHFSSIFTVKVGAGGLRGADGQDTILQFATVSVVAQGGKAGRINTAGLLAPGAGGEGFNSGGGGGQGESGLIGKAGAWQSGPFNGGADGSDSTSETLLGGDGGKGGSTSGGTGGKGGSFVVASIPKCAVGGGGGGGGSPYVGKGGNGGSANTSPNGQNGTIGGGGGGGAGGCQIREGDALLILPPGDGANGGAGYCLLVCSK
jgi:hypothetical protein